MHSNDAWRGVSDAFAPMVWDYPGAPAACLAHFKGVTVGRWTVNLNGF